MSDDQEHQPTNIELAETALHFALTGLDDAIENSINARVEGLVEALKMLHDETVDYVQINNLGNPWHNQSMKLAKEALSKFNNQGE